MTNSSALSILLAVLASSIVWSQERGEQVIDERPLVEREPYDLITLVDNQTIKVLPLPLAGRRVPRDPDPQTPLRVRLYEDDESEYDVFWRDIKHIELFEHGLLEEAKRLTEAEEFDEAFTYYYRLRTSYRGLPGLEDSLNRFLYLESHLPVAQRLQHTRPFPDRSQCPLGRQPTASSP